MPATVRAEPIQALMVLTPLRPARSWPNDPSPQPSARSEPALRPCCLTPHRRQRRCAGLTSGPASVVTFRVCRVTRTSVRADRCRCLRTHAVPGDAEHIFPTLRPAPVPTKSTHVATSGGAALTHCRASLVPSPALATGPGGVSRPRPLSLCGSYRLSWRRPAWVANRVC